MKITALEVDGYGAWSGLKIEGLADGLNVLYGPNEAGKTTLLQFIRSVLYGFSPRRRNYFPPLRGGRPGGSLDVAGPNGRFHLERYDDENGRPGQELLTLTAADGTRVGEHFIKVLLSQLDEAIYNNVFAVGLREMQQLGTLSGTQAAELLYNLTAGLDRVSLVEVMRELEASRSGILDAGGRPCRLVQLFRQREELRTELEDLDKLTRRYGRLAAAREELERELARLEEENNGTEHQARVVELAITLRARWSQRAELLDQLSALGPAGAMPDGAVGRLDAVNARLQKHQQRVEQLQRRREEFRREAAGLDLNEALWRQAAQIEALIEQEPWITGLSGQVGELETEIAELQSSLAGEQQRLGLPRQTEPVSLPTVSTASLAALRPPAKRLKQCRERLDKAKQEAAEASEEAQSLARQIEASLSACEQSDLAVALDSAGNLASQFRRRVQVDERLDELTRYQAELEEQSRRLIDRQLLPVWVLAGLGGVFVLGVVLVLAGLLMPASVTGSLGWTLALLGLAGGGLAGGGKVMLERSNIRQLEACQKQLSMLQLQIQQTKEERDTLDRELPHGGGPIVSRLDAAEKELAALEELVPLESRRTAARQQSRAVAERVARAEEELAAARRRWRQSLAGVGLPESLVPKQVKQLVRHCDQIGELHRRLEHRREELGRRRRELDLLLGRIDQLVADTGVTAGGSQPVEQLRQLGEALGRQEACVQRRETLRRQAREVRRRRAKHEEAIGRLKHRRRELLLSTGVENEQEFRRRAVQAARAEVLKKERESLDREIAAAIDGHCPEDAVREQLEDRGVEELEARRDELLLRLDAMEKQLQHRFEKRGQLAEQLKTLADDRQIAEKRLELAMVEKRIEDAVGRWQALAVTNSILDGIRTTYEQQRQPETLQEASGYLDRLTGGRYCRVWTPLGEDVLKVDDAQGNALQVEVLSRGTREQLFLALRLALAASYARRGAPLPLVLDDVLVNFDAHRAKAAAAVLRDFAKAGHQLLVFTCHEHILKLFKSSRVSISRLPDNAQPDPAPIVFEQPVSKKTRQSKKAEPAAVVVEQPEEESIEDEIALDQCPEADVLEPADDDVPWDEEEVDEDDEQEEEEEEDDEEEEPADEEEEDEWEEADDDEDEYEDDDTAEAA